jgi:hypothetical protein
MSLSLSLSHIEDCGNTQHPKSQSESTKDIILSLTSPILSSALIYTSSVLSELPCRWECACRSRSAELITDAAAVDRYLRIEVPVGDEKPYRSDPSDRDREDTQLSGRVL